MVAVVLTDCPYCTVPGLRRDHAGPCAHRMWHANGTPCDNVDCDQPTHHTDREHKGDVW